MPTELGRAFSKNALIRTTHDVPNNLLAGATKIGIDALGDIAAGDLRTVLRAFKAQYDAHAGAGTAHSATQVSYAGSANLVAAHVEAALDELDTEKASNTALTDHTGQGTGAHAATAISYAGSTNLSSTNVETAIDELDTEKLAASDSRLTEQAAGTASVRALGTGATNAAPGNDSRFTTAASETVVGHVELATTSETTTGTDTTRAVTPAGVKAVADTKASATALTDHINDTSDAHDASAISYAGGTGISATDVEAALDELATEKSNDGHTHNGLAPSGGTTGQVLKKLSDTNYDYSWQADSGGSGGTAAVDISYSGSTNLSSTNVEAALDELDSEKLAASDSRLTEQAAGTASVRALGTGATNAAPGNDSRFTTAASETVVGHVELATTSETTTGTDTTRAVTPAGVKAVADTKANTGDLAAKADQTSLDNHINDTVDAHDATAISYAGSTNLSSTTVEAALDELDSEKLASSDSRLTEQAAGTASVRALGTGATNAAPGNDSRFTTAASETVVGHVELATTSETTTGTDTTRAVTPAGVKAVADTKASTTALSDHLNDTTDAHDATAISYAGGTGMSATDVEAAIDELATEKLNSGAFTYYALSLGKSGTLTTGNGTHRVAIHTTGTLVKVFAKVNTAPTGASIIVDVNKNGTSVWATTQANRVTIAASGTSATQTSFDTTAVTEDDYLTVDIDQIGSTIAGADLVVVIKVRATLT